MPRIAYFPDSFHEVNGVAHTSRNFQAYAQRHGIPFLCVRAALPASNLVAPVLAVSGSITTLDLPRGGARIRLERDLDFDPLLWRYRGEVLRALRHFAPTVIHITGPSDVGLLGLWAARKLRVPLAMGWHTNLHEYAGRRAANMLGWLPAGARGQVNRTAERATLAATLRFYRFAAVTFAPNPELIALLQTHTGKPCGHMERGLDTELFSPARRRRPPEDGRLVLGYVGRLSSEKNILRLVSLERELAARGIAAEFVIVGHGMEEGRLRAEMRNAVFPGVLRGEALAEAYADMDLFVFPSETDTFGNVVLEALASGVPELVTDKGGPKFLVREGATGFVTGVDHFADVIAGFAKMPAGKRQAMRDCARADAMKRSWDAVFDGVLAHYPGAVIP